MTSEGTTAPNEAKAGAEPPQWLRELPSVAAHVVRFFYWDLVEPGENIHSRSQKCIVSVGSVLAFAAPLLPIFTFSTPHTLATGLYVSQLAICALSLFWMTMFALLKACRQMSHLLIPAWFTGTLLLMIIIDVGLPSYPMPICYALIALACVASKPPHSRKFIALSTFGYLLSAYNEGVYLPTAPPVIPSATIPGAVVYATVIEPLRDRLINLVMTGLVAALLVVHQIEYTNQIEVEKASTAFAALVGEALCRYDTDAAAELLAAARRVADVEKQPGATDAVAVNPELLATFETIIDNLRRYRPHLPNWVVRQSDDEDGGSADHDARSSDGGASSARSRTAPGAMSSRSSSSNPDSGSARHRSSPASPHLQSRQCENGTRAHRAISSGSDLTAAHKTKVVVAHVDFVFGAGCVASSADAFVDRVHTVAAQTSAAIHCFVGDRLIATWNAAMTTVQAEVKAGRFLSRLIHDSGDATVGVSGIATAFHTRVYLAGGAKQNALLVGADPHEATVAEAKRLATTYRTIIVNGALRQAADNAIVFRGVGLVPRRTGATSPREFSTPFPGKAASNWEGLYQVRSEHCEADDEWLYVLEKHARGNSGDALLSRAVDAALREDWALCRDLTEQALCIQTPDAITHDVATALRELPHVDELPQAPRVAPTTFEPVEVPTSGNVPTV
jgi:hypothetical protein